MKLEINFDNKEIKVLEKVQFKELLDKLKKMFPEDYKDYVLDCNVTTVIHNNYPYWKWHNNYWYGIDPYIGSTSSIGNATIYGLKSYNSKSEYSTTQEQRDISNIERINEQPKSGTCIVEV